MVLKKVEKANAVSMSMSILVSTKQLEPFWPIMRIRSNLFFTVKGDSVVEIVGGDLLTGLSGDFLPLDYNFCNYKSCTSFSSTYSIFCAS